MATIDERTPLWPQNQSPTFYNHNGRGVQDDGDGHEHSTTCFDIGPPKDPWHLSYWIMVIQGTAMLLPWNVFITANGFFQLRFKGSPYESNFQNYFSVAFMGTALLVVGSSIMIQKKTPSTTHIIGGLLLNTFVFLSIMISIQSSRVIDPTTYFFFVLTMLSLTAISTSIVQNGMFGLASKFTGHHVQGVVLGQGVAGAGVAISQIVTQVISPPKNPLQPMGVFFSSDGGHGRRREGLEHSAFLYFSVAMGFTLFAALAQALLTRLPIYGYYMEERPRQPIQFISADDNDNDDGDNETDRLLHARRNSVSTVDTMVTTATITPSVVAEQNRRYQEEQQHQQEHDRRRHIRESSLGAVALATEESATRLMEELYPKKKKHPLLILYISISITFGLTLSLFPSISALVESTNTDPNRSRIFGDLFTPLHFLLYNLGDWLGKGLPSFPWFTPNLILPTHRQHFTYLASAFLRIGFIPLFLSANLPVAADKRLIPLWITQDEIWFITIFIFALTNGYLGCIIMMVGPSCVLGGENKARAGIKLGFWLSFGLALGSVASFGVRALMCSRGGCVV
ncbi:hypothetical protein DFQ26_002970 [Actinomortierella ambigua]|nr:hypothetical protein DFQ26_002970 [Actinomortierella ambigua]